MRQAITAECVAEVLARLFQRHGRDPMSAMEPWHAGLRLQAAAVWAADNAQSLDDLRTVARSFRVDWRKLVGPVLEMAQLFRIGAEAQAVPSRLMQPAVEPTVEEMLASVRRLNAIDARFADVPA